MAQKYFGDWVIEQELGKGAFGTVYKIKREQFGTTYYNAMKVITIPQDSGEKKRLFAEGMDNNGLSVYYRQVVQDFINEIELMASLQGNTNIVAYHDHKIVNHPDGIGYTIYIRMEYLTPLENYWLLKGKGNQMQQSEVLRLGIDLCNALELCDRKNIIHRDIKPDNIFVSENGDFKLGDFGIARRLEKTQSGLSKKGTFTYMAPEVYAGKNYNKTVDIYSLGIVLYKLLNHNRAPFLPPFPQPIKYTDHENAMVLRMRGTPIPKIPGVSDQLNAIVLKCCAFQPAERYQSATELKQQLLAIAAMQQNAQQPNESVEEPWDTDNNTYTTIYDDTEHIQNVNSHTSHNYLNNNQNAAAVYANANGAQNPNAYEHQTMAFDNEPQNMYGVNVQRPVAAKPQQSGKKGWIIALVCSFAFLAIVGLIVGGGLVIHAIRNPETTTTAPSTTVEQTTQPPTTQEQTTQEQTTKPADIMEQMKPTLNNLVKSSAQPHCSLTIVDMNSGKMNTFGDIDAQNASALVLYPVLFAYSEKIDAGELSTSDEIPLFTDKGGTGRSELCKDKKKNDLISIDTLFRYAFEYSDNAAINTLMNESGLRQIQYYCNDRGYSSVIVQKFVGEQIDACNQISSRDLAEMIYQMLERDGYAAKVMHAHKGTINDDFGRQGIAYRMNGEYETLNGYVGELYNEVVHIDNYNGEYIVVMLSDGSAADDGVYTAEQIGDYLRECLE